MTLLKAILAILNAIPILDRWFTELQYQNTQKKVSQNNRGFMEGLENAKQMGSAKAVARDIGKFLD